MATTKITSNVLALSAAQTNINNDGSFTLSVPTQINNTLSLSGNLTVDTNTFFVNSANNRVGIGTNNPQQAIDFRPVPYEINQSGGIRFDNTAGQWPCGIYIRSDGSGIPRLSLDAPYQTNTLNLYNNFVGIGTTTPNEKLHIYDSVDAHLKIAGADTAGSIRKLSLERSTGGAEIHFNEDTRATQGLTLNTTNAAYPMSFQINGDTKMFVSTAGSVGIGTLSALIGKLDVTGSPTTTTPSDVLVLSRPFNAGIGFPSIVSFKLANPNSSINNTRLDIALMQGNSSTPRSPDTTVMTLMGNGNDGIGTTTPNEKLTVVGNISATGNLTVDTNTLFVDSVNNSVGVGTTSPTAGYILDVKGNGLIYNSSGATTLDIRAGSTQSSTVLQTWRDSSNTILSQMYPTGAMTTQGYALAGQSIISFGANILNFGTNTYWQNLNYGNASTIRHYFTGNVGIGTATPNEKLTVVGNISATGIVTAEGNKLAAETFAIAMAIAIG